jgi:hypothetical protein
MFVGFGTLSGGAHTAGQNGDRSSFQLVSTAKSFYFPGQCRATLEVNARKQRDGKLVKPGEKAKQNWQASIHAQQLCS